MDQMEHMDSSRDHLETWNGLTKLYIWGSAATAVLLLVMAITLV